MPKGKFTRPMTRPQRQAAKISKFFGINSRMSEKLKRDQQFRGLDSRIQMRKLNKKGSKK